MCTLTKQFIISSIRAIKVHRIQVRHFALKALKQEHVTPLNQETLTGRILLYLNIDNASNKQPQIQTKSTNQLDSLYKLSTGDILKHLNYLARQKADINKSNLLTLAGKFDTEACLRLAEINVDTTLEILDHFMNLIPHRITELKYYRMAIKDLSGKLKTLTKTQFLKFVFYAGLQKKSESSRMVLRSCLNLLKDDFVNSLGLEEVCIISNAFFKASIKISNPTFLGKVKMAIDENLYVLKDPALFTTLLKTIRHNRNQDDNLLGTISCGISFNKTLEFYSFPACCHILALFADYLYFDDIVSVFTNRCLEQLQNTSFHNKNTYLVDQPRGKDIARFLWVLSIFSEFDLVSKTQIETVIIPKILERIKAGEFTNDMNSLVDITLYLWMLNYKPKQIVPYVLHPEKIRKIDTKSKGKFRLNLLLHCIQAEDLELYKSLRIQPRKTSYEVSHDFQLTQRPLLERILSNLNSLAPQFEMREFGISQEVPFLNVFGITGYTSHGKKAVFVEILDDYTCVKNVAEDIPGGVMALKLRLLDRRPEGVLVVSQREINGMTEAQVKELLEDELKLIC